MYLKNMLDTKKVMWLKGSEQMIKVNVFKKSVLIFMLLIISTVVYAHGERNQEPFLRMKTLHWYDAVSYTHLTLPTICSV